ncbi:ubiquitin carboxyl-terminal hydrolase [Cercophora scortea]|uniref:Ubiquitin carboxyl-terminal hydrolase n=1 Tax=Cercophora scortea TaxID=314031 RepID=A0AAE0J5Q0_9PEZI|nr:ubiquitin carboxyl-terminal hydrolase [Cercophora scortea]
MAGFFQKLKVAGTGNSKTDINGSPKNKKEEALLELTPLERLLQNAGSVREDGSDKFFGLENFGNTCYCNSIVQALYYSEPFRENVVNYPAFTPSDTPDGKPPKVNVSIRPPIQQNGNAAGPGKGQKGLTNAQAMKQRQAINTGQLPAGGQPVRPEDRPDSPEYKKKQAMIKGPVLELAQDNPDAYGMQECTFTGLKDIFTALIESEARTGVLSPQRFLDIFKRDNEMFRNSMHQDAHEFYGLVLNDVIANVETNAKRIQERVRKQNEEGLAQSVKNAFSASSAVKINAAAGARTPGTGWVHDIFEGVLVSETKCLTCETASQRDETFLDLSIDLEEHSSVTSCLQKFSAEEMLCERNKFHCDHCGGLQEAEKRMKIKKLPKVLALHLKRFKYTEDYSRLSKLFHRVVYPYHLRMFNTTDDAEDPDRMYELYAVVVHIGSNAYHGHYVSVIKTKDRGWLLFDDEMVEPVDKHFVRNFFGDKPGQACAYVLFYQEVAFEKVREEQDAEGWEEVRLASQNTDIGSTAEQVNGNGTVPLSKLNSQPAIPVENHDTLATLQHAKTAPGEMPSAVPDPPPPLPVQTGSQHLAAVPPTPAPAAVSKADEAAAKSKEDKSRDKKEQKAQEKARKAAEKEAARLEEKERAEKQARIRETAKAEQEQLQKAVRESKQLAAEEKKRRKETADAAEGAGEKNPGFLNRASRGSKSMTRKSFAFLNKGDKGDKSDRRSEKSDKSDNKVDIHNMATTDGSALASSSSAQQHQQHKANGNSSGHSPVRTQQQDRPDSASTAGPAVLASPEKFDPKPLKERFSFGLGRKKSSRFLS